MSEFENGLSVEEIGDVVREFMKEYVGNVPFGVAVRERIETSEETCDRTTILIKNPGDRYIYLPLDKMDDPSPEDIKRTLRGMVLGEYGLDTFSPEDQRDILRAIIESKNHPSIKPIWDSVASGTDEYYPQVFLAKEVFCKVAEDSNTFLADGWQRVREALKKGLQAFGLIREEITADDLKGLAQEISKGIKAGQRSYRKTVMNEHEAVIFQAEPHRKFGYEFHPPKRSMGLSR